MLVYIPRGPDDSDELARLAQDRMADRMLVLDGSVGKKNAEVRFISGFLGEASLVNFTEALAILGMHSAKPKFNVRSVIIASGAPDSMALWVGCDYPGYNTVLIT